MAILQEKRLKALTFIGVIVAVTIYTYTTEYLTDKGYKVGNIMTIRGTTALILGCIAGLIFKMKLTPNEFKPQVIRFFINGFASYFSVLSFVYLSATTIGLINRLDIPALILLAIIIGQKKSANQFWLSVWTMIIIGFLAINAQFLDEKPLGFLFAFINVFLISAGYLLVQKTSRSESPVTLNNVFSFSNIIFGLSITFLKNDPLLVKIADLPMIIMGATGQLAIYIFAVKLYQWYSVEKARLPYILTTISIAIFEMIYEHKVFNLSHLTLLLIISGLLLTIILNPGIPRLNFSSQLKRFVK